MTLAIYVVKPATGVRCRGGGGGGGGGGSCIMHISYWVKMCVVRNNQQLEYSASNNQITAQIDLRIN